MNGDQGESNNLAFNNEGEVFLEQHQWTVGICSKVGKKVGIISAGEVGVTSDYVNWFYNSGVLNHVMLPVMVYIIGQVLQNDNKVEWKMHRNMSVKYVSIPNNSVTLLDPGLNAVEKSKKSLPE
ncbi:hypothetical protein GIB67_041099 [Kingdonia uniflora]|uniref:Uncharacterized protein n=1 Tax=Kingdonia uniflora TaxID=39325 RepID=A0A7J7LK35_9MAGN|nr:hypothetical protein GIB67_041099 [Kingdonia uniflora]